MKNLPTLRTRRLMLRPFEPADAPDVQRLAGDRAIADTTLNIPHPYEDGMAEEWIATHQAGFEAGELANFAVVLQASDELIGTIGMHIDSRNNGELGYWIGRPFWGNGYCTEAAAAVLRYAFSDLDLQRIHASHLLRNPASGRVMEKLGMVREGMRRQQETKCGRREDLLDYGLLRDEWQRLYEQYN